MRDTKTRLEDILEAIDQVEKYTATGRAEFERNELVQSWVVRHLQIIGEAANKIPTDIQSRYSDLPWSKMIGMRNILVHDYFGIDLEVVWSVVEKELPYLKQQVHTVLKGVL